MSEAKREVWAIEYKGSPVAVHLERGNESTTFEHYEVVRYVPEVSAQGEAGRVELRASVRWFAEQMELGLRRNDGKGGWHECDPGDLVDRVREEVEEMAEAADSICDGAEKETVLEAADVGAMAMMVADHFREGGPSRDQGHTLLAPPLKGSK